MSGSRNKSGFELNRYSLDMGNMLNKTAGHALQQSFDSVKSGSFGIFGYRAPKVGLPPRPPQYVLDKDKKHSLLN